MRAAVPDAARARRVWSPARPESIPRLRGWTVGTLREWRVDAGATETAELVVAELATNALRVSTPVVETNEPDSGDADEFVAVRLSVGDGRVMVQVWDRDDSAMPRRSVAGLWDESGRGLALVEALCDRWSAYRAASGGKVVWAQFPGVVLPEQRPAHAAPLQRRVSREIPAPLYPVRFSDDPEVLRRVADRLRALDPWHLAGSDEVALLAGVAP